MKHGRLRATMCVVIALMVSPVSVAAQGPFFYRVGSQP